MVTAAIEVSDGALSLTGATISENSLIKAPVDFKLWDCQLSGMEEEEN